MSFVADPEALREALAIALHDAMCVPSCRDDVSTYGAYFATADALAPLIAEREAAARAEAWDQGYRSGLSNAMRRMSDEPNAPTTPNPYATEVPL